MSIIHEYNKNNIRIIELCHSNKHNPYNKELKQNVKAALERANDEDTVKAIVLTGGKNRSFSVGADFNEVKELSGNEDVDQWIDDVVEFYASILKVIKPTVAAIDGYAIGMGFQMSQMFDWRVMSQSAEFWMPELKYGIGCSMGATILTNTLGYNIMKEIVYGCEKIDSTKALEYGIANEVVNPSHLLERAIDVAQILANYPEVSFRNTKAVINENLLTSLYKIAEKSKSVHRACFSERSSQIHFKNILKEKYRPISSTNNQASQPLIIQ